jgi:acyl-CoA reductase-like NAD-dependent aldehyde dehydrogenase
MELTVFNPRTGEIVSRVPVTDGATCDDSIARACAPFAAWAQTSSAERAAAMRAAASDVRAAADELAELNGRETGKLRRTRWAACSLARIRLHSTPSLDRCTAAIACRAAGAQQI